MSYLENVIKAAGGYAAPAEPLTEGKKSAPEGYHYMPDGTLMRDDEHSTREALKAAGHLVPEEQDLADALLEIVEEHGKFNADNTGVWAGYTSAEENADNAKIGVKCGNCVFWDAPNGCKIIIAETEEAGLCRFAVLPDGAVNPKDKPVEKYFEKSPALLQEELKKKIKEMENDYKEEYVEISDLTPTQEVVSVDNFKDAENYGKPVIVYKDESGMKLVDGHHRCASRVDAGHSGIKAKIYQGPLLSAALEKDSDDPCWEGYVQLGMKMKRGKLVPNCVPIKAAQSLELIQSAMSSDDLEEVLALYNSKVGPARQVALSAAAEVAARSFVGYRDAYADEELSEAVLWELHSYLEYATLGLEDDVDVVSSHNDLLNEGHPARALTASLEARARWAAAAPELEESSREAVITALSSSADEIEVLHATSRIKALVSSGVLSAHTSALVNSLLSN